jgi:hypothetical protein
VLRRLLPQLGVGLVSGGPLEEAVDPVVPPLVDCVTAGAASRIPCLLIPALMLVLVV